MKWPIRLYSRYNDWTEFIATRPWEKNSIPELNAFIATLLPEFPQTTEDLNDLLLPLLVEIMREHPDHKTRYIATLGIGALGSERARKVSQDLREALSDNHGSVRQAARMLLKQLGETTTANRSGAVNNLPAPPPDCH
jgi:hypothetical protein